MSVIGSLIDDEDDDNENWHQREKNINKVDDAIPFVKKYEAIIKIKKKGIINIAYRQGVLVKRFRESDKFMEKMKDIEVSRSTLYFNLSSASPTKWSNTLKQFVGKLFECVWSCCGIGASSVDTKLVKILDKYQS